MASTRKKSTRPSKPKTVSSKEEREPSSSNLQGLKGDIDNLKANINVLVERFSGVQDVLREMQVDLHDLKERLPQREREQGSGHIEQIGHSSKQFPMESSQRLPTQTFQSFKQSSLTGIHSAITSFYNAARNDQAIRPRFREKYKPFFINVTNDVERRRDGSLPPDFRRSTQGSYLAVVHNSEAAIVFPDFTLVIVDSVYGPGGLGEVFECPEYNRRSSYPNIQVTEPAIFKLQGGDSWGVDKKGVLQLGQGQDA